MIDTDVELGPVDGRSMATSCSIRSHPARPPWPLTVVRGNIKGTQCPGGLTGPILKYGQRSRETWTRGRLDKAKPDTNRKTLKLEELCLLGCYAVWLL
jgi:hypothetical protein